MESPRVMYLPEVPFLSASSSTSEVLHFVDVVTSALEMLDGLTCDWLKSRLVWANVDDAVQLEVKILLNRDITQAERMLAAVVHRYGKRQSLVQLRQEFANAEQLPGESCGRFARRLYILFNSILLKQCKSMISEDDDTWLCKQFIEKVAQPALRCLLERTMATVKSPKFLELWEAAIDWELDAESEEEEEGHDGGEVEAEECDVERQHGLRCDEEQQEEELLEADGEQLNLLLPQTLLPGEDLPPLSSCVSVEPEVLPPEMLKLPNLPAEWLLGLPDLLPPEMSKPSDHPAKWVSGPPDLQTLVFELQDLRSCPHSPPTLKISDCSLPVELSEQTTEMQVCEQQGVSHDKLPQRQGEVPRTVRHSAQQCSTVVYRPDIDEVSNISVLPPGAGPPHSCRKSHYRS